MGDVKTIIEKQSLKGLSQKNDIKGEMQPTIIYVADIFKLLVT